MKSTYIAYVGVFLLLAVMLTAPASAAVSLEINIDKSFKEGDAVTFSYSLISDKTEEVNYSLGIDCPDAPIPLIQMNSATLNKGETYSGTYTAMTVSSETEPQECKAIIGTVENSAEKIFEIKTKPSFLFNINTCRDSGCTEKTKVFVKGENIYFAIDSEVENPSVDIMMALPDKSKQKITLPDSISANQLGIYEIKITGSKEGYKTKDKTEQFAVIDKEPKIKSASVCDGDGTCSKSENAGNCPSDCGKKQESLWKMITGKITGFFAKLFDGD